MTDTTSASSLPLVENDSTSQAGLFSFDPESRTLRGNLLPLGVNSRPSVTGHVGHFTAETLSLPRDPSVVTLNRSHSQHDPVGRATVLEVRESPAPHLYAEFVLGDTDEADQWLTEQRDSLSKLSPEVFYAADRLHGRLTGAALVTEGAWKDAALFEVAPDEVAPEAMAELAAYIETVRDQARAVIVQANAVLSSLPTDTPADAEGTEPDATPVQETNSPTEETEAMPSIVPDAPGASTPVVRDDARAMFAAVANRSSNPEALAPFAGAGALFAIQNVQESGPSSRTIYADTAVPAAIGELWDKQAYSQRFLPLLNQASLTSMTVRGWRWVAKPEVADYAGNLAEVPSNVIDTEPVEAKALRLAGGHKIDRAYFDFSDTSVIDSYFTLQAEDVARQLDAKALAAIQGAATVTTPGTVPTGVSKGLAAIVDGALGVMDTENRPAYAIVDKSLYRDIALMRDQDKLAFLNAGFGLEEGDFASFKIVPGNIGAGKVIVGAREALTFYTLPGTPIRVEGLDVHHGGVDVAVFAYYASIASNAAAIRSVTVASA